MRGAVAQIHATGTLPGRLGETVAAEVANGRPLSEALARFPVEIPAEDVALLEAGEATGHLDRCLDRVAARHEARRAARRRFWSAAAYPTLLYHLAALLMPVPAAFARDGHLFGSTWLSGFLARLVPFYALLGALALLRRGPRGRALLRRLVFLLPGFGHVARRRRSADFAEILGAAYGAGVPLDRALRIAGRAAEDPGAAAAAESVARGRTLAESLSAAAAVPAPLLARISIGEQAGDLSRVLDDIAREEADAADHLLRRSVQLAAYLFYMAVAFWIGWHVISMYAGIYSAAR